MDEKQILLVKVSWSFLNKKPDLFEEIFIKKLLAVCPQIGDSRKNEYFKGISNLINMLVLNIHSFQNTYELLDPFVKKLEIEGCDKHSYNKIVRAFLSSIEKLHGNDWDLDTKTSWVMAITSLSYRYSERLATIQNRI